MNGCSKKIFHHFHQLIKPRPDSLIEPVIEYGDFTSSLFKDRLVAATSFFLVGPVGVVSTNASLITLNLFDLQFFKEKLNSKIRLKV